MQEKRTHILTTCYNCGNTGLLNIFGETSQDFGGPIFDEIGNAVDFELLEKYHWYLLKCPVCFRISLYEEYTNEAQDWNDRNVLFPYNKNKHVGVPDHIKSAFESAIRVKGINNAICLLSLRMTLEAMCKDKKAEGKTLEEMIKDLVKKNILPIHLDDACWIIRQLGNEAAHEEKAVFFSYEVDKVIIFVERIVDYLYSLPYEITRLKKSVERRKKKG